MTKKKRELHRGNAYEVSICGWHKNEELDQVPATTRHIVKARDERRAVQLAHGSICTYCKVDHVTVRCLNAKPIS